MLEQLQQHNLFIVPLDDERHWYRYHHLFAELLRARLGQAHSGQRGRTASPGQYMVRAARVLAEAVQHALAAGAFEQVAHLIEPMGLMVFTLGPMQHTLNNWLASLPVEFVRFGLSSASFRPGCCSHQRDLEAALRRLKEAEQALHNKLATTGMIIVIPRERSPRHGRS